jgi:hypothetical protein
MTKINNSKELREEIIRMKVIVNEKKEEMKEEIFLFKENFRPGNIIKYLITDLTGVKMEKESFLKDGFAYTISLFIQQFLLKSERKFESSVYGLVDSLIDRIRNLVNSFSGHEAKRKERTGE